MTHNNKRKFVVMAGAFILSAVFLMMALQPAAATQREPAIAPAMIPQAITQANQTMAYENTNVTWSNYNSSMARNEYLNGTGAPNYINAEPSTMFKNYISIEPSHIIAPKVLQADGLGNLNTTWDRSLWGTNGAVANVSVSSSWANVSNMPEEKLMVDISGSHGSIWAYMSYAINAPNYSSQNLIYDYLTAVTSVSVPTNSGALGALMLWNSSAKGTDFIKNQPSGVYYLSGSLAQIQKEYGYSVTFNTTAGKGYSSYLEIQPDLFIPSGAPDGTYSLTLTGLALTTYPITFGANSTGVTVTNSTGDLQLANFHPDISNVSIVSGGYSEALSMPAMMAGNYTETQNQISTGDYIEETTTQASFAFPTGTDISYSETNITLALNGISGDQIPVLDINGVSYTNELTSLTGNETFSAGSVNPNQPNNVIYQVYYTADQWNSITAPPFFLSIQGIEYYWWVFIIGTFGAIGIFAGLRDYATGKEENARTPKAPKVR